MTILCPSLKSLVVDDDVDDDDLLFESFQIWNYGVSRVTCLPRWLWVMFNVVLFYHSDIPNSPLWPFSAFSFHNFQFIDTHFKCTILDKLIIIPSCQHLQ